MLMGETLASYGELNMVAEENKRPGETKTTGKRKTRKIYTISVVYDQLDSRWQMDKNTPEVWTWKWTEV